MKPLHRFPAVVRIFGWILLVVGMLLSGVQAATLVMGVPGAAVNLLLSLLLVVGGLALATPRAKS